MSTTLTETEGLILLNPNQGRKYKLGALTAVFKADEEETDEQYSISEWWLDPKSEGPGVHCHEGHDEIFYVLEGTCSFRIADEWVHAERGSFLKIPASVQHDFANRTDFRAGFLNFFVPGGFERHMPSIVKWFKENK